MKEAENEQLNRMERMLDGFVEYATERFSNFEDRFCKLEENIQGIKREQRAVKLELLDKLASVDRVDSHELRIQQLESKTGQYDLV